MLIVVVLGAVALGWTLTDTDQDIREIMHRIVWFVLMTGILGVLFRVYYRKSEINVRRVLLMTVLIVVQMFITRCMVNSLPIHILGYEITENQLLLILPYVLAPSMVTAMMSRRLGVYVTLGTTLFGMTLMKQDTTMTNYMVLSLVAGLLSSMLCERMQKRAVIGGSGAIAGGVVFVTALLLGCLRTDGQSNTWGACAIFCFELAAAVGVGFITCTFLGGLMPHMERLFGITTHFKWLEMGDLNNQLLKEFSLMAPGTFHHCQCTKTLAEDAAQEVGVYVTRVGVCALYHDIGKMKNPMYFTENLTDQANSPHNERTAKESARIIKRHVQDGVEMAIGQGQKLDQRITDVIREHHGRLHVGFFYRKALEKYKEDKKKFDDGLIDTCPDEVREDDFLYDGPIPQSRESGIISMADAVESATRSLGSNCTDEDRRRKIDEIFRERIQNGHLRDSQLTLGELDKIKESFLRTLARIHHSRISYNTPNKQEDKQEVPTKSAP